MEAGDEEALAVWRRFRNLSIEKYKVTYARLGIQFDVYGGESQVKSESIERAEKTLKENGITEFNRGATILNFKNHGAKKLETAVIRNRNGTTNYLLRDIGSSIERWETYRPDKNIYVIMSEQDLHVARNFKATELLGGEFAQAAKTMQHVNFGKVQGMSTRKGTVKFLDDILEEVGTAMHDVMKKNETKYSQVEDPAATSDILGISAVMVQDMSGKRINNYHFDISRMTSFEGDTGPYLQYAHARLCSIFRKAELTPDQLEQADFSLLKEPHAIDLLRLMAQYPDICIHAFGTLEPTTILTYLFKMTHQLSSSYDVLKVVKAPEGPETGKARAALYWAARQVLGNGMRLLGLRPVDRM
jgi:arginyl-tRNA synthetase